MYVRYVLFRAYTIYMYANTVVGSTNKRLYPDFYKKHFLCRCFFKMTTVGNLSRVNTHPCDGLSKLNETNLPRTAMGIKPHKRILVILVRHCLLR